MHKIQAKEFTLEDFSCEHLMTKNNSQIEDYVPVIFKTDENDKLKELFVSKAFLNLTIMALNTYREKFLETKDKKYWWQMIQLLPSSYNQKRTITLNYQVLRAMYFARRHHKLDEWRDFCNWIESLPYAKELICYEKEKK